VAELKKQEAINSSNSHADSKANEALNNAKAFVNAEITTVKSHLNKATAEINVLKEKIESKVSQSDIDKSIQEIKIGGINLLRNSDYSKYSKYENIGWDESLNGSLRPYLWSDYNSGVSNPSEGYHAHLNITKFSYPVMEFNCVSTSRWLGSSQYFSPGIIKPNCEYTFSIYLYGDSDTSECQAGLYYFKNGSDRQSFYSGLNKFNIKKGEWNRYEFTFKTSDDLDVSKSSSFYIYGYYKIGKFYCTKSKLEEGKFATGYSKAPEDMDQLIIDNIKTVTDKITTVESKFTQENNSIKASVQDLNSTTQSITTNVSNINRDLTSKINSNLDAAKNFATDIATNKANTAKQEAISSANSHADNIAASKADEALNNAKAYTNAEITTINSKVHNVESGINILKDKINSKVSQSDIDKSISEIKLGGRNLILRSDVELEGTSPKDIQVGKLSDTQFITGKTVTVSLDLEFEDLSGGNRVGYEMALAFEDGSTQYIGCWYYVGSSPKTFNGRISSVWNVRQGRIINIHYSGLYIQCNGKRIKIGRPKIELGNKATDWSPAPEDLNQSIADNIKIVDSKISDVSSSVTQLRDSVTTDIRAINSKTQSIETTLNGKASKQEVTEVNNRVATIKASLDGITQRVSATESKTQTLESNLNGKASKQEVSNVSSKVVSLETNLNGITNRVSNTESRINTLDGKVASAVTNQQFTEFKQSNDKFKFTVEQRSSVSNILPNGSFFGGDRGWLHDGVEFWYGAYSGYGFKGRMTGAIKNRTAYNNPERFLQTHKAYKVKKNTTYTISFHYACEMNIHSMEAYVVLSDTEHGDYAQPIRILEKPGGTQSDPNNEIPFTYKFNTGNHEWVWLRFDHNGMKPGTNWDQYCWLYVSEIGIYEGDVGAVKWTPKGGEVYSANYQMDGLGFKGTFEDGTYASLGRDGLEWYNAGTGHAYHALTYVTSFDIPVGNPGKAYIKLPAEFTKRRSSLKWTVALRGYYYSTSGNFFPFHVHCTGARDYIENGLVVCEVQGLCKIQNGSNSGDVQFRPLTAMLIAIA
ncbi:carbohydrate binding domain-containing protein, partial [Clostridium perfringens]